MSGRPPYALLEWISSHVNLTGLSIGIAIMQWLIAAGMGGLAVTMWRIRRAQGRLAAADVRLNGQLDELNKLLENTTGAIIEAVALRDRVMVLEDELRRHASSDLLHAGVPDVR